MGDLSRMERCNRFVEAFKNMAEEISAMPAAPWVEEQGLGVDQSRWEVRFHYTVKDANDRIYELNDGMVWFDPESDSSNVVENTLCIFDVVDEDKEKKIIEMLKAADLIDEDYGIEEED
jgi:hypothetical protein